MLLKVLGKELPFILGVGVILVYEPKVHIGLSGNGLTLFLLSKQVVQGVIFNVLLDLLVFLVGVEISQIVTGAAKDLSVVRS